MGRFYWLLIIFTLSFSLTSAQDKVIEHPILKGETVYGISKTYGVSVDAIYALNPGSREVIYAGDTLQIPKDAKLANTGSTTSSSTDTEKYVVVHGDTKSSLSRKFGVSIASLEQQNPQIVPTLMVGHVLQIDKNFKVQHQTRPGEHFVLKGETLWRIAKYNNISVDALVEANHDRLSGVLKAGQTLRIPENDIVFNKSGEYIVKTGDTKWSLSKRFDMSIAELEAKNPQIVRLLMAGHRLKITTNDAPVAANKPKENNTDETDSALETKKAEVAAASKNKTEKDKVATSEAEVKTKPKHAAEEKKPAVTEAEQTKDTLKASNQAKNAIAKDSIMPKKNVNTVVKTEPNTKVEIHENGEAKDQSKTASEVVAEAKNTVDKDSIISAEDSKTIAKTQPEPSIETKDTVEAKNETETPVQNPSEETAVYRDYVIQPNETLYGLSKMAGMSIKAFTELNPQLAAGVSTGAVIKMPKKAVSKSKNQDAGSSSIATSEVIRTNPNETLFKHLDKSKNTELYICLPFSLEDYESGIRSKVESTDEDQDLKKYVDFYQGAEMAIDSARVLGLNFDVTVLKNNDSGSFSRIKTNNTSEENAVIVPFLKPKQNYPKIISKNPTAIVGINQQIVANEDNTVYNALASERELKTRTLKFITSKNTQVVVVSDLEEARNKALILKYAPDAKFLKVDKTGFFEGKGLTSALDKNKLNYIILDTDRTVVFLNATTEFMGKLADYKIEMVLIESASLPKPGQVSDMRFRILKLIFPSLLPIVKSETVLQFEQAYKSRFQTEASENAIIGFDTTFDVLLRLAQENGFQNSVERVDSNQINLKFEYQKSEDTNYENKGMYLFQFGDGNKIIEIE